MSAPAADIVIPTCGRPQLRELLRALAAGSEQPPGRILVVDDRKRTSGPLPRPPRKLRERVEVIRGPARGPAAARNAGWRASGADWIAFLDDDVIPHPDWAARLARDIQDLGPEVAASQGRVRVPLPENRPPTDWERNVSGLEGAAWITANIAYRRAVLEEVGGFDERFPRAYREDADLGLRVTRRGYRIVRGERIVDHPVRPAGPLASVRLQAGNADDALMWALHGSGWRERAGAPKGRRKMHLLTTALGFLGIAGALANRRKLGLLGAAGWLAATAEFAARRIAPGPRTLPEVMAVLLSSALIPPAAALWWLWGLARLPALLGDAGRAPLPNGGPPRAVLFDRDGTLIVDVPYNGDPARVIPMPGAREALERLRSAGVRLGVVTNQSGIGRRLLSREQVAAVNRRVEELLGPFEAWAVCPHAPEDRCACRKPAPAMILQATEDLGVEPGRCAVVGDIGSDVEAARAAGARAVLVPTGRTRPEEVRAAPEVAPDLRSAVELLLNGSAR
ncbi:HAD-IIIA family hydrolase [Rubrobacter taiwanensis]|uniref:D,D-heptose 1,7-bisphosphate phosphatase n=1 Tax=Rubrobacter taiwanensis TaxID=185139 RepID=A0A4R1BHT5_9ACTN|nr:HAD-IIIA family hydrolase [Rubrobacter taiwanensis]TCJ16835.1 HAD-IIIA family hydrolase [Rubrobacter taiwanensis]